VNNRADIAAERAEDEALEWLVDFEDLSEAEEQRFNAWISEWPENRAAFERVERDWRQLDVVRQLAADGPDPKIVDKWLRQRHLKRRYLPLAAVGAAALVFVLLLPPPQDFEAGYRTPVGQHEKVLLPDESIITLNTNSEATVRFSDEERRVHLLSGEAHFNVAPDPERPFSVIAGSGAVQAVGTAFNVHLKGDVVEVTVTQGVVHILQNVVPTVEHKSPDTPSAAEVNMSAAKTLKQGQKLEYDESIRSVSRFDPRQVARELAWQDGMLDFQGETLAEVIEEASRYTSTRMTIEDPDIEGLHVTGYFRAADVDTLLRLIESNERVEVHRVHPRLVRITASRD
jgi:transmembrane sensor